MKRSVKILAAVLAAVLLLCGLTGCNKDKGGDGKNNGNDTIARGESASVKNSKIELNDGAYLDFGANTVADGKASVIYTWSKSSN